MSRTVLTEVEGFTPVMDNVMKDTSPTTAIVFGSMWRYCQMQNGVCQATLDKIAERAGLSKQAIIEHIKILETAGYIEDTTPDLRNHPHTYKDTGKAGLHMGVSALNVVDSEKPALTVVDSALNVVDSHVNPRLIEDSIKIETKKEISSSEITFFNIQQCYETKIGLMTPLMAHEIQSLLDKNIPEDWIMDAITETGQAERPSWSYAAAILKRWEVEGRAPKGKVKKAPALHGKAVEDKFAAFLNRVPSHS